MENDMQWMHKPDPYKDFQDDGERRLALQHRERWLTYRVVGSALASPLAALLGWYLLKQIKQLL
jgi:hypothetical protein